MLAWGRDLCRHLRVVSSIRFTRCKFSDRGLALLPARLQTNPGQFVLIVMKVQEPRTWNGAEFAHHLEICRPLKFDRANEAASLQPVESLRYE